MGARNNRNLKEVKNKGAKAAALNKKFKKKPCSFCRDKVTYIDYKDMRPFASTSQIAERSALAASQAHAHNTSAQ
jgi:ribosomal protein S18